MLRRGFLAVCALLPFLGKKRRKRNEEDWVDGVSVCVSNDPNRNGSDVRFLTVRVCLAEAIASRKLKKEDDLEWVQLFAFKLTEDEGELERWHPKAAK